MKKLLALALALCLGLTGCGGSKKPENITADHSTTVMPETTVLLEDGQWPENDYTRALPQPPGQVSWVLLDKEHDCCGIQVTGISKDQFKAYTNQLKEARFYEMEQVAQKAEGGAYVSIGSLYSNGSQALSLAYAEPVLMLAVLNQPVHGTAGTFLDRTNLTNVHMNAYATYDEQAGIQSVTELYVPVDEEIKPAFTALGGIVTLTVPGETTRHYFGALEDHTESIASAISTDVLGNSGDKGRMIVSGLAFADNAVAGGGAFTVHYEITLP